MKFLSKYKQFLCGVLSTVIFLSLTLQVSALSTGASLDVYYNNIKLYIDQKLITPTDANGNVVEPFIYNGTTYLPVRAVAQALGKAVTWDDSTSSVYIGKEPGQYMSDLIQSYYDNGASYEVNKTMTLSGNTYYKGFKINIGDWYFDYDREIDFNLNGQYSNIEGLIGLEDNHPYKNTVDVIILGDNNVIGDYKLKAGDMPQDIKMNVQNINKLTIKYKDVAAPGFPTSIDLANITIQ